MKTKEVLNGLYGLFLSGSGPWDPSIIIDDVHDGHMGSTSGTLIVGEERFHIQISEF